MSARASPSRTDSCSPSSSGRGVISPVEWRGKGPNNKSGPLGKEKRSHPRSSPTATPNGGGGKKLACDNCRERKVRCNREQPVCGRCTRLGHKCRYTAPVAKQNQSHTEMSRLLLTLHSRLAQTEARLAGTPPLVDQNQVINGEWNTNHGDLWPLDSLEMQQQIPPSDMGSLHNLTTTEQMSQSELDIWLVYTRVQAPN